MSTTTLTKACDNTHCSISLVTPKGIEDHHHSHSFTRKVAHEMYSTAFKMPGSLLRLTSDIWSHYKDQPKKPSWDIQMTIVMGAMQAFRDETVSHSLGFWRCMTRVPSILTPWNAKLKSQTIQVRSRGLCGILSGLDKAEKGSSLEAEWISTSLPNPTKIVLYLHGGAYCSMSAQTHRVLTYKIAKSTQRRLLAVNYRLAPETKFPGALYDVVQTYLDLIDPEGDHRLNSKDIIVMGDSAGGGLCMAMLLYIRDHHLPKPEGAALLSPWVDLTFSYPSWAEASLYDYLPSDPAKVVTMNPATLYLDNIELVKHPYVSPIFADNFDDLPPILLQSGGCESLRDEIRHLYEKLKLSRATQVLHEEYEDMVHVFQAFPFSKSSEAIERIGWWTKYGIPLINQVKK